MKKLLAFGAIVGILGAISPVSHAATQTDSFTVTVALTSYCTVTTPAAVTIDFGTYDAATGLASTPNPTGNLTMDCTRGLTPPTFVLDTAAGTKGSGAAATVGGAALDGWGVLNGLNYAVAITGTRTAGTAPTPTAGSQGLPAVYTFAISGSMPAGQYGTCTTDACVAASHVRTITVTY